MLDGIVRILRTTGGGYVELLDIMVATVLRDIRHVLPGPLREHGHGVLVIVGRGAPRGSGPCRRRDGGRARRRCQRHAPGADNCAHLPAAGASVQLYNNKLQLKTMQSVPC